MAFTERGLFKLVEVNSIEIKLKVIFFRQNLYEPLAGRIKYIAVKMLFYETRLVEYANDNSLILKIDVNVQGSWLILLFMFHRILSLVRVWPKHVK